MRASYLRSDFLLRAGVTMWLRRLGRALGSGRKRLHCISSLQADGTVKNGMAGCRTTVPRRRSAFPGTALAAVLMWPLICTVGGCYTYTTFTGNPASLPGRRTIPEVRFVLADSNAVTTRPGELRYVPTDVGLPVLEPGHGGGYFITKGLRDDGRLFNGFLSDSSIARTEIVRLDPLRTLLGGIVAVAGVAVLMSVAYGLTVN